MAFGVEVHIYAFQDQEVRIRACLQACQMEAIVNDAPLGAAPGCCKTTDVRTTVKERPFRAALSANKKGL
jgi:hypothetical protein